MTTGLDADQLIRAAEKETGLSDWGGDEFLVPFHSLVDAINREARLNPLGARRSRTWLQARLCQRLRVFEDRKRDPRIAGQKIERPVFITGLPRAGTTYTHALLASDPANIGPLLWQWYRTSPPPNLPGLDHEKTIREIDAFMEDQGWKSPEMLAQHDHHAQAPEECSFGFELSFVNLNFTGYWNIPGYAAMLPDHWAESYRMHRKLLQAMQLGAEGRRWILKAPEHITHIDFLFAEYPDAVIVQNHRDPSRVMASVLSVIATMQRLYSDSVQKIDRAYGLYFMQMYAGALSHAISLRKQPAMAARFVDVHYLELERDPVAVMRNIYAHAGMPFTDAALTSITHWVATNRQGKHGKHRYSLADYGLTQKDVWDAFEEYLVVFDIEREPVS